MNSQNASTTVTGPDPRARTSRRRSVACFPPRIRNERPFAATAYHAAAGARHTWQGRVTPRRGSRRSPSAPIVPTRPGSTGLCGYRTRRRSSSVGVPRPRRQLVSSPTAGRPPVSQRASRPLGQPAAYPSGCAGDTFTRLRYPPGRSKAAGRRPVWTAPLAERRGGPGGRTSRCTGAGRLHSGPDPAFAAAIAVARRFKSSLSASPLVRAGNPQVAPAAALGREEVAPELARKLAPAVRLPARTI